VKTGVPGIGIWHLASGIGIAGARHRQPRICIQQHPPAGRAAEAVHSCSSTQCCVLVRRASQSQARSHRNQPASSQSSAPGPAGSWQQLAGPLQAAHRLARRQPTASGSPPSQQHQAAGRSRHRPCPQNDKLGSSQLSLCACRSGLLCLVSSWRGVLLATGHRLPAAGCWLLAPAPGAPGGCQ
jgi:hypothetical protein